MAHCTDASCVDVWLKRARDERRLSSAAREARQYERIVACPVVNASRLGIVGISANGIRCRSEHASIVEDGEAAVWMVDGRDDVSVTRQVLDQRRIIRACDALSFREDDQWKRF